MANDTIGISTPTKTERYALNGGMTVGEALAKFYNVGVRDVANKVVGMTVRLENGTVNVPEDLAQPLRGGDFISIYPADIARGGVKGAEA